MKASTHACKYRDERIESCGSVGRRRLQTGIGRKRKTKQEEEIRHRWALILISVMNHIGLSLISKPPISDLRRQSQNVSPSARLMYGEYWFRLSCLSMMVIGSFASYTKTKSVESAV
jgi:hypothetical protein